jgi:hypothetical protein
MPTHPMKKDTTFKSCASKIFHAAAACFGMQNSVPRPLGFGFRSSVALMT